MQQLHTDGWYCAIAQTITCGCSRLQIGYHDVIFFIIISTMLLLMLKVHFLKCGGIECVLNMLTRTDFLQHADAITKR